MTLVESTSEQLIKDFTTFILPSDMIKYVSSKNVIVHLNKLILFCKNNKLKSELQEQQLQYIKEKYK